MCTLRCGQDACHRITVEDFAYKCIVLSADAVMGASLATALLRGNNEQDAPLRPLHQVHLCDDCFPLHGPYFDTIASTLTKNLLVR
jgi:hypothetical protein